jgi:D-inositol-3-phosphate glycosyltransferase
MPNTNELEAVAEAGAFPRPAIALQCLSESWGGLEINTIKFAGWMRERGWPVTLLVPPGTPLQEQARRAGLPHVAVGYWRRTLAFLAARRVAKHLRRHNIKLLIVTQNKGLGFSSLVKLFMSRRLRLVYQQHMQIGRPKKDWFHTRRFGLLDAWLSPLPGLVRQVGDFTHYDTSRVHLVPIGLDVQRFQEPRISKAAARQQLQLPATSPLLGLLGRFDDGKGQDFVIDVLHELRSRHQQPVELVLMGEPTHNEGDAYWLALREQVQRLGLEQQVHFRPYSEQVEVFYQAIDVFVLASTSETYGMVTLEAMAAGRPVVASRTGGTPELVDHGRTGLLYPLRDVEACARQVLCCLEQPACSQELGQRAQQHVSAHYDYRQQCELTEKVLLQLL